MVASDSVFTLAKWDCSMVSTPWQCSTFIFENGSFIVDVVIGFILELQLVLYLGGSHRFGNIFQHYNLGYCSGA